MASYLKLKKKIIFDGLKRIDMQTWYECKVKYLKIDQGGHERKVNDSYLLDAVSFTDAEARIFHQMHQLTNGAFQVENIKKSNITEVIPSEDGEWWYKAKISLVTIDEEGGKEKKVSQYILLMADDINQALVRLDKGLSYLLVPYVTTAIQLSPIAEVFPYFEDEELKAKEIARKPAAEVQADIEEEEEQAVPANEEDTSEEGVSIEEDEDLEE